MTTAGNGKSAEPVAVPDNQIAGRLALITGASGGIGSACARQLAAKGVNLALTYASNQTAAESLAAELRQLPNPTTNTPLRVTVHKCDLASADETTQLCLDVQAAHSNAAIDILVSNAGYGKRIVDVLEIPLSEFDHTLNVNLRASFLLVQGVVPSMRAQKWGRIIFVGSIAAYGGGANGCHYAASKGGLMAMMKNLSTRLAQYNISVNDVAPAMVHGTGMFPSADTIPGLVDTIPLRRMCEPVEVANAVVMFTETGFATGQSLVIAGGLK